MQATSKADPPELAQLKASISQSFRGMDRGFAALDQAMGELSRAKADCVEAQDKAAAIFNGPGPRHFLTASAYRQTALESEDPAFLKRVLVDAWRKGDWAFDALAKLAAGETPDSIEGLPA